MSAAAGERILNLLGDFFAGFASPMPLLLVAAASALIALVAAAPSRRGQPDVARHSPDTPLAVHLAPVAPPAPPDPSPWPVGMASPLAKRQLRAAQARPRPGR
jgi:hypothetical protein